MQTFFLHISTLVTQYVFKVNTDMLRETCTVVRSRSCLSNNRDAPGTEPTAIVFNQEQLF